MIKKSLAKILIIFSLLICSYQGVAMSLFFGEKNKTDIVLFSPLEGKLTINGSPLSETKIKLHISWKDKKGEFFYHTTDSNGFFKIPEIKSEYKENPLAQLVIQQILSVDHEGQEYNIWVMSKMNPAIFTELDGEPIDLVCEITDELVTTRGKESLGGTNCKWKSLKK